LEGDEYSKAVTIYDFILQNDNTWEMAWRLVEGLLQANQYTPARILAKGFRNGE
jgi:hypothetical protein